MRVSAEKRIIPILLILVLCAGLLCGCGRNGEGIIKPKFDASAYVKGGLDVLYLGEVSDDYLELVVDTREDCLAMYEKNIRNEAENFCEMFYVAVNDEPDAALLQLYKDVFAKSRYEVGEAEKTDGGYAVPVTVYPMDIFRSSYEALDMYDRDFTERFSEGEFADVSGSELESAYLQGMIDILRDSVQNTGYLDPVTVTLQLSLDKDGVCHIDDAGYAELHNSIIAY